MSTRIEKTIVVVHRASAKPSLYAAIRPSRMPPRTAPLRFPIPPRTAAVNAYRPRRKPSWKFVVPM
jgi:hypothetical protein